MGLMTAYDVYSDVKDKSERGRQFYEKLLSGLGELEDKLEGLEEEWTKVKDRMKQEFREEEEKKQAEEAAAARAQHTAASYRPTTTNPMPTAERPKGERLKDYLEYYRAKKAGGTALPPPSTSGPVVAPIDYGTVYVQYCKASCV